MHEQLQNVGQRLQEKRHGKGSSDYSYGTTPNEVYDLLVEQCGLKISTMQSWLNNGSVLAEKEFSELFYRGIECYFVATPEDGRGGRL